MRTSCRESESEPEHQPQNSQRTSNNQARRQKSKKSEGGKKSQEAGNAYFYQQSADLAIRPTKGDNARIWHKHQVEEKKEGNLKERAFTHAGSARAGRVENSVSGNNHRRESRE